MSSETEQQGPFHIERKGECVSVTCRQHFSATLHIGQAAYNVPVARFGNLYAIQAVALSKSMRIVLSCVGYDDVVIEGGQDA